MRPILTLLLMILAAPAWAEWVRYAEDAVASYYYDPATIKKRGNNMHLRELSDLKERQKDGELSLGARALPNTERIHDIFPGAARVINDPTQRKKR